MNAFEIHGAGLPFPNPDTETRAPEIPALRPGSLGARTNSRHRRLAAVLQGCSEQPDFLFFLVGVEGISETLSIPAGAVERMITARPGVRLRLARRVRTRLGLTLQHLEAGRRLPDDPGDVSEAARFFGVAIRLAGGNRVLPRAAYQAMQDRYGAEAVAFGMSRLGALGANAEILAEFREGEPPTATDKRLFVRSLAALGHVGAPVVALKLGFPPSLAIAEVANVDLALETGLPGIALAALALISETPRGVNAEDAAAWRSDAFEDDRFQDDPAQDEDGGGDEPDAEPPPPDTDEAA